MRPVDAVHRRDGTISTAEPNVIACRQPIESSWISSARPRRRRVVGNQHRGPAGHDLLPSRRRRAGTRAAARWCDRRSPCRGPEHAVEHVGRVVDAANALRPDVVVLLGDYIATHRFVTEHVLPTSGRRIRPPRRPARGVGDPRQPRLVAWRRRGTRRARQRRHSVPRKPGRFAGRGRRPILDRRPRGPAGAPGRARQIPRRGRSAGTLAQVTTDHPVILLAHEPDIFVKVPPRVCLTLAGHTHGGQIRIPLLWPSFVPSRYGARFHERPDRFARCWRRPDGAVTIASAPCSGARLCGCERARRSQLETGRS